ncbi:MAG: MmcQ/YjbR family DNA-binding protein [Caulobacterales bacterium]|nr:MmcQ/YjbR family DNA-binding protein [Caulobacterales bacterium]
MSREEIEACALGLPAATKVVQWGGSDVYKVGGKVFAVAGIRDGLAFKVSPIGYEVLTSGGPARQAPYFAKGHWVIVDFEALEAEDVRGWIEAAHGLIAGKLPRAVRAELGLA